MGMWYWPGLDRWPPPKEVWIAAAVMAFVVMPVLMLMGVVGKVIFGVILAICIVVAARARLKQMNVRAEEFRRSGPED